MICLLKIRRVSLKAYENYEDRLKMAEMHDDILAKIKSSYNDESYIETCWLCYACFENRVERIMEKLNCVCSKPKRTSRFAGITTKLKCLKRLMKSNYEMLDSSDVDLINNIIAWCYKRNKLTHSLITLEQYEKSDDEFALLAEKGIGLVEQSYTLGTNVRNYYYNTDALEMLPEEIVKKCELKSKCTYDKGENI